MEGSTTRSSARWWRVECSRQWSSSRDIYLVFLRLEMFNVNQEATEVQALVCINFFLWDVVCIFLFLFIPPFFVLIIIILFSLRLCDGHGVAVQICWAREDVKGVIVFEYEWMNLATAILLWFLPLFCKWGAHIILRH